MAENPKKPEDSAPAGEEATTSPEPAFTVEEIGGPKGPEPTRFGDWSVKGRCVDF